HEWQLPMPNGLRGGSCDLAAWGTAANGETQASQSVQPRMVLVLILYPRCTSITDRRPWRLTENLPISSFWPPPDGLGILTGRDLPEGPTMLKAVPASLLLLAVGGPGDPVLEKRDLFEAGQGGYTMYRIPGLVVTSKGTLLAYCEARKG